MRTPSVIAALAVASFAVAGCASTHVSKVQPTVTVTQSAPAQQSSSAPDTSSQDLTGPVGTMYTVTTQDNNGNDVIYGVTAMQVVDPATGSDQFSTPDPGNRFVGVKFKITGMSGHSSDDANNDAVLQGDDGQVYNSDFNSITAGTNFNSGSFTVSKGGSQVGWVTFQVPKGVKVSQVQWDPNSGMSGDQPAVWTVGRL